MAAIFKQFHGLLAATRAPYQSMDGVLNAIRLAREQNCHISPCEAVSNIYTLLEYARYVRGIADAAQERIIPGASN